MATPQFSRVPALPRVITPGGRIKSVASHAAWHVIRRANVALFVLLLLPTLGLASEWVPVKKQDGVQIEGRVRPETSFREFRGAVELNAKPDQVVRLLQDLSNISTWHYGTEKVEVIRTLGFTDALVQVIIAPPWPLKRREAICKISLVVDEENNLIRITLSDQPDELAPNPGYQRVERLEAEWIIKQASETTSLVQYSIYTEPGGKIPRWFFNNVAMDVPLFTLLNLRRHFLKAKAG